MIKSNWVKIVAITTLIAIVLVAIVSFYGWYKLHELLHVHIAPGDKTPSDYGLTYEGYSFKSLDDIDLAAWYVPVENPKAVIIIAHGYNDSGKVEFLPYARFLHDNGYASFLLDLRAFGYSSGNQVSIGTKEWQDVVAAYDFVRDNLVDSNVSVGFLGKSLGAATVVIANGYTGKGDFVIAEVPYAHFVGLFEPQMKERGYSAVLMPFLKIAMYFELGFGYTKFEPIKMAKNITVPLLAISAQYDESVYPTDAKEIYETAKGEKVYWFAPSGHNVYIDLSEEYKNKVTDFLDTYVAKD